MTFYIQYSNLVGEEQRYIIILIALSLIEGLIILALLLALLIERARRRRTEDPLAANRQALGESQARVEDLASKLIIAQEEERKYLARELHDDLNQQVAALAIGLGRLERQLPDARESVYTELRKIEDRTMQLSERIRRLSHELHSSTLEHVGLGAALKSYCSEFTELEGIEVSLAIQQNLETITTETALCLYRIAQESLRNIAKHSGTRNAEVILAGTDKTVELYVVDQGVGFDPQEANSRPGLGLVSMKERVRLLHGDFQIKSHPGAGTELRVSIPLRTDL